jgi:hypothetical protein
MDWNYWRKELYGEWCWWSNLASMKKPDHPVFYSGLSNFSRFSEQEQDMSYIRRFEDPRSFEAWKGAKKYQEANMEEIQARSQSHKNLTVQF